MDDCHALSHSLSALFVANLLPTFSESWWHAADRRAQFEKLEYTEEDYQEELRHIEEVWAQHIERPVPYKSCHWRCSQVGSLVLKVELWCSICQVFTPLVEKCKKYGRAMRIGTNHGSLSDRIMSYYGDSPRGMVSFHLPPFVLCNGRHVLVEVDGKASSWLADRAAFCRQLCR